MGRNKKDEADRKYNLKVSLNENLLNKIDDLVKKSGDKRSRLIERLLREYIEDKINKKK